ncbi:MAG: TetR/AcrR family transcriptional regulator [Chrysiogenetes bacterium]|nr:TetR/AcrR family transcriptional regulator [Chrysiogenetes bacterium]
MPRRIPQQKRSKQKVDAIIRHTLRIIENEGYPRATTARIAKEAGIGLASLYEYFENRDDIILAALELEAAAVWRAVESGLLKINELGPVEGLRYALHVTMSEVTRRAGSVQILLSNFPGVIRHPAVVKLNTRLEATLRFVLISMSNGTEIQNLDTKAFLLTNTVMGIFLGVATGLPEGVTEEDLIDEIVTAAQTLLGIQKPD